MTPQTLIPDQNQGLDITSLSKIGTDLKNTNGKIQLEVGKGPPRQVESSLKSSVTPKELRQNPIASQTKEIQERLLRESISSKDIKKMPSMAKGPVVPAATSVESDNGGSGTLENIHSKVSIP